MWLLGVASRCGHWVWPVGVVAGCDHSLPSFFPSSCHLGGHVVGEFLLGSKSTSYLGLAGALVEMVVIR